MSIKVKNPVTGQTFTPSGDISQYTNMGWTTVDVPDAPATTPTTPTAADIYGNLNYETPEQRKFREDQAKNNLDTANNPIDEATIRKNTLAKFQSEIDALNRIYAEKKRVEMIAGQGRLGAVAAIGNRRGLLGSDFGVAQENNQTQANQEAIDAIEAERALKEQNILSTARKMSEDEVIAKTAAKKLGAENYLKYITESSQRKQTNVEEIAKQLYASGTYDENKLKDIADSLGVSIESLKTAYNEYKKSSDAAAEAKKTEKEQALLKEGYTYIKTPAERDALKAKGYEIVELGERTYSKKPKTTTKTVKVGSTTYSITQDEMGNIINKSVIGAGGGNPKPTNNEKTALEEVLALVPQAAGSDGFISPEEHLNLRNQWIQQGYNPTTFDNKIKGFLNPNNPNYVTKKQ